MDILERFKKYIAIDTKSDENSTTYPSTYTQVEFAKILVEDLKELGVKEVELTSDGLVYAHINNGSNKTIGLIAHMDTSPALDGGIKNPQIIKRYNGDTIILNENYKMSPLDFPILNDLVDEDLITTDGEHLLGGDDKAGIVIIFDFVQEYLKNIHNYKYNLAICFTPDEEIGCGSIKFDVNKMKANIAYTLDGESIYEANFENFNAASAHLNIKGLGVHPGNAKDVMVNALLLGIEFNNLLPQDMIPSKTEGHEGFIHLDYLKGDVEEANLAYIIRDHDLKLLEEKKNLMIKAKEIIEKKYPKACVDLKIEDSYKNMKYYFLNDDTAIEMINRAYLKSKQKIKYVPIRGGTDGANITYMGLPCPNLGVGDFNPHGRYEIVSLTQMKKMSIILMNLFTIDFLNIKE